MHLLVTAHDGTERRLELGERAVTIGRAIDNVLAYPKDPALSRYHLAIEPAEAGWWQARDCGSRNGTVVNGAPLTSPRKLAPGDRIYAGQLTIEVKPASSTVAERIITGRRDDRGSTIVTTLDEVLQKARSEEPGTDDSRLRTNKAVAALIRAGQELSGHRPLDELFEVILDLALSAVNARRGMILIEGTGGAITVRAQRGDALALSSGVREQVMRQRAALLISDAQAHEALRNHESILLQQIRSILAVPLQTNERVIGLIYADNATTLQPFTQSDLELLTVMANVAAIRIEHARLAEVEQEERILQTEMSQASDIQRSLLPLEPPSLPGYEVAGFNLPCRAVGGDYYDFLPYSDGSLAVCIADVCGKGLGAALMMTSLQARVQMLAEAEPKPGAALTSLNRNLAPRFPEGKFITCLYGVLTPQTGGFTFASAGHNYPMLRRADGSICVLKPGDLVLGLLPGIAYRDHHVTLEPGDSLFLYSDGVTEAARRGGEYFGEGRLADFLQQTNNEAPCRKWIEELAARVRAWCGSAVFPDDFTAVVLRRG